MNNINFSIFLILFCCFSTILFLDCNAEETIQINELLDYENSKLHSMQEKQLPNCFNTIEDISRQSLDGNWIFKSYSNLGHFSKGYGIKEWWLESCPVQMAIYSCNHHDKSKTTGKGFMAQNQYYKLSSCKLNSFSPYSFLTMMTNRTMVICCDSTSQQFFSMLACSLHGTTKTEYQLTWFHESKFQQQDCIPNTGIHCHLGSSTVYYPEINFTLKLFTTHLNPISNRHITENYLQDYIVNGKLTFHDILLLNNGVHFTSADKLTTYVTNIATEYHNMNIFQRPLLIWRESLAQHFNTSDDPSFPVGYGRAKQTDPCIPIEDIQKAIQTDYRNNIANHIMESYNIPILKVRNASITAIEQQVGYQHRSDDRLVYDCTHYCENSGLYYYERELLFNALTILLPSRESKLSLSSKNGS